MTSHPWDFSVPDWEQRMRAGRSLVPDLPLDETLATKAVSLFDKLKLPDVPDQPTLGEAAGDWQRDIVRAIFGSLVNGERKVPEVFLLVPKKNSKTTGGAGMALTGLLMNERPRAEFIYVGPTQEVADLAFQQTKGMIEADEEEYLGKRFHVQEHIKTITDRRTKAKLKIKTFDGKVVTGSTAHGLRKAGCTRLANAGHSEAEIMAWSGHQTAKEVQRYTRARDQKRLADRASKGLNQEQEMATHPLRVSHSDR